MTVDGKRTLGRTIAVVVGSLALLACSGSSGDDAIGVGGVEGGADDGGATIDGASDAAVATDSGTHADADAGPSGLIWPNAQSFANSDPWLVDHHDEITEMHPRALILDFANGRSTPDVMARWNRMSQAMSAGSTYHGYSDPSAKPFIIHEVLKVVDLKDNPVPANWTAPNSTKMPRKNGGIDFAQLYGQAFADLYGIPDPQDPSHNMTLCELMKKGFVHELFIVFNKTGSDANVPEIIEYKQKYDDNDRPLADQFDPYAGNGAFDPADLPEARACGRSLRVDFVEMTGTLGGSLHVLSHNFEHLDSALPIFKKFFFPLFNRDFDARFHTPFQDWYGLSVNGGGANFLVYNGQNSVSWACPAGSSCAGQTGTMAPFDEGCGNCHYAPNSRNSYDMTNTDVVLTRCEHYGLQDGPGGKDIQTPYSAATIQAYAQKYGADGNGGGWQVYLFQSFPGVRTKAKTPDGKHIKNFWPYLYY